MSVNIAAGQQALPPQVAVRDVIVQTAVEVGMLPWRLEYDRHDARYIDRRTALVNEAGLAEWPSADVWQSVIDTLNWRIAQRAGDEHRSVCGACNRPAITGVTSPGGKALLVDVMSVPDGHWQVIATHPMGAHLLFGIVEPHKRRPGGTYYDSHELTCVRRARV